MSHHICKSERYANVARSLFDWFELDSMTTLTRWSEHKKLLRETGRLVRNEEMARGSLGVAHCFGLAHLARVLCAQDVARTEVLQRRCPDAARFLRIEGSSVVICDARQFATASSQQTPP